MPLTRNQLIASAAQKLGKRTDLVTDMETEILVVQSQILEGHHWLPWFLETEDATLVSVAGTESIALPTDFLLEDVENRGLEINLPSDSDEPWQEVKKDDLSIIRQKYPGDGGQPLMYALRGSNIMLRPIPDAVYTFRLNYFARDDELTTDVANLWTTEAADLLIAELCYLMAKDYIKDPESAAGFQTDVQRAWGRLYRKHTARREGGGMRMVGDE